MSCSGCEYGSGWRRTAFTTVNIPVVAPIPSIRQSTAAAVKLGFLRIIRTANRKSCQSVSMGHLHPVKVRSIRGACSRQLRIIDVPNELQSLPIARSGIAKDRGRIVDGLALRLYFAEGSSPSIIRVMPGCEFAFPARTSVDALHQT